MSYQNEVYLSTVCLETNRWNGKPPVVKVSDWLEPIREAGFDGIELWEKHALLCDDEEREKLMNSPVPIKIYNTYLSGDPREEANRLKAKELALALGAEGMKFNFAKNPENIMGEVSVMDHWLGSFPQGFRRLCELHRGTSVSVDDLFSARTILSSMKSPIEAISHAFDQGQTDFLYKHIHFLGTRLTHIHAQRIRERGVDGELSVKILKDCGFSGSFSVEFTTGVADPHEDTDNIFDNARKDLEMLRLWIGKEK